MFTLFIGSLLYLPISRNIPLARNGIRHRVSALH